MIAMRSIRQLFMTPLIIMYFIVMILFFIGPVHVGFLSDDFDLIDRASRTKWLYPLEVHHWSPILATLFKATSAGIIGRTTWCILAFLTHCINISLVWAILTRRLKVDKLQAWAITLLFTLCPAGFEAISWSCAVGYPLVTMFILISFYYVCRDEIDFGDKAMSGLLALLQIIALQVWDWGILLFPILMLCFASHILAAEDRKVAFFRGLRALWPAFICLMIYITTKSITGQSFGYTLHINIVNSIRTLITTPLWGLYPDGSAAFYKSTYKHLVTVCIISILFYASIKDSRIRLLTSIFILCQLPYIFLSYPESRYFYIGSFFLYSSIVLCMGFIKTPRYRIGLTVLLVLVSAIMSINRALLWKGAFRESDRIRMSIDNFADQTHCKQLVVINLPDRYGPKGMMWRPYVWRNGLTAFNVQIARVNTNDAPFTWPEIWIPELNRKETFIKYPNLPVIEVAYNNSTSWKKFKLIKLLSKNFDADKPNSSEQLEAIDLP